MVELVGSDWRAVVGVLSAVLWGLGVMILGGVAYFIRERVALQLVLSIPAAFYIVYYL